VICALSRAPGSVTTWVAPERKLVETIWFWTNPMLASECQKAFPAAGDTQVYVVIVSTS
jgi:hypothetical protein